MKCSILLSYCWKIVENPLDSGRIFISRALESALHTRWLSLHRPAGGSTTLRDPPLGFADLVSSQFPLAGGPHTVRFAPLSASSLGMLEVCVPSGGRGQTRRLDSVCSARVYLKCTLAFQVKLSGWRLRPLHLCWTLYRLC